MGKQLSEVLPDLFGQPPPPAAPRLRPRLSAREREAEKARLLKQMKRAGQKLPQQASLRMRLRRPGASFEIKRRQHETTGNSEFQSLSTAGAIRIQVLFFADSIRRLTGGDYTDRDIAETWAWIDTADGIMPFGFVSCLQAYANDVDRDPDWICEGIERLRPHWLVDHTIRPEAYATYWLALVLA